jgi:choice-of-anchor B domain-containing protein
MKLYHFLFLVPFTLTPFSAMADRVQGMQVVAKQNLHSADGYSAIWGYTAPDGREYALLGVQTGTAIVDITESSNLKEIAFIPGPKTPWRELKTFGQYAYVVTDNAKSGVQIIDLSKLPNSAALVNTYPDQPMNHTLWVDAPQKILYLLGGTGEFVVGLSLEDPIHLKEIVRFGSTYVHDAYISGGLAFLSEILSKSFSIWDMANPLSPKLIKRERDENAPRVSFHNSWPTQDGKHLITTEETTGRTVKFWDIQDLTKPKLVAEYLPPNGLIHNVQIKGNYAYFSSYGGGIRILDITDPTKPTEVASWARKDGLEKSFVSVWGVYPFFKSGKIIASDMELGLIVTFFDKAQE